MRIAVPAITLGLVLVACARREAAPPARQAARATPPAADSEPATAAPPAAPAPGPPRPAPAATQGEPARALLGTWDLYPAAGARGPHLTLVVDSARGTAFFGHVTRALSGDVELGPDSFRPFRGGVASDGIARVGIEAKEKGAPRTDVAGRVAGPTWSITSFVWGGEEQVGAGRKWEAKRARK